MGVAGSGGVVGVNFHVSFLREDGQKNVHTPLDQIARHVDYLVERMGIDHVAFGSDFDGAAIPRDLGDVTGLPKLMALLAERGYSVEDLEKIAHRNWLRLLRETWRSESRRATVTQGDPREATGLVPSPNRAGSPLPASKERSEG